MSRRRHKGWRWRQAHRGGTLLKGEHPLIFRAQNIEEMKLTSVADDNGSGKESRILHIVL